MDEEVYINEDNGTIVSILIEEFVPHATFVTIGC